MWSRRNEGVFVRFCGYSVGHRLASLGVHTGFLGHMGVHADVSGGGGGGGGVGGGGVAILILTWCEAGEMNGSSSGFVGTVWGTGWRRWGYILDSWVTWVSMLMSVVVVVGGYYTNTDLMWSRRNERIFIRFCGYSVGHRLASLGVHTGFLGHMGVHADVSGGGGGGLLY